MSVLDEMEKEGLIGGPDVAEGEVILRSASSIRPEKVGWAWEGYIVRRSMNLLVGIQGQGKTLLGTDLIARLSRGQLAGDYFGTPVSSIVASSEDSPAHTHVPRLIAAGADLGRVFFCSVSRDFGESGLVVPEDVAALERAAVRESAQLVLIDPLLAHFGSEINSHRDQDVRRAMAPLTRFAEDTATAVLAVAHLNKSAASDVFHKVGGSMGLTAAPRSVLFMAPRPGQEEESPERVLVHAKCNVAEASPTLKFKVEGREINTDEGEQFITAGLAWCGPDPSIRARDLLSTEDDERQGALEEAKEFLEDYLADGPVASGDAQKAALKAGHSERTIRRARKALGIKPRKEGAPGSKDQHWVWELPIEGGQQESKSAKVATDERQANSWPPSNMANEGANTEAWPSRPPSETNGHLRGVALLQEQLSAETVEDAHAS